MDTVRFKRDYLSLYQKLYRVAYYILESEADAEDALQELYLKLWNLRDHLELIRNPQSYGSLMIRNLCIDRIRKRLPSDALKEEMAGL